jgi:ABC-2 type transport system ATP-binding protein
MTSIIKTEGLGHKYSASWAIRDINIDIAEAGAYGLVGANGAGKSTTMNIMCGSLNPTAGAVYINGTDIRKDPMKAKQQLGFCPQTVPLYEDLTASEYLTYCAELRRMNPSGIPAAVEQVMDECGISNLKDRLVKNLSGGYRQRVGLAQAIIHDPKLVILDEPTTGLDPVKIAELHNLIGKIARHSTVIISSHILSEIQAICQEIIMIEQGQVVFSDSTQAFENYMAPESMLLTFRESPSVVDLEAVEGVTRAEKQAHGKYKIFFDGEEVSERLVEASVRRGWRLAELTVEKNTMEEIFEQLTKKTLTN